MKKFVLLIFLAAFGLTYTHAAENMINIKIHKLSKAPVLDGSDAEWGKIEAVKIPLSHINPKMKVRVDSVMLRGAVSGDRIYFIAQWKDEAANDKTHKPFVWDEGKKKYGQDKKALEDRFAMQFEISGDYTTNWLSGNSFVADMWHWKAFRSNTIGLAHDKKTVISTKKIRKSFRGNTADGKKVYISRPGDAGDKLYKTMRYREKENNVMPKYKLNPGAKGSVADVKANGVWKNGMWTLELSRKLNTGNDDDVEFILGKTLKGGIAVFNNSGNRDHFYSPVLLYQL